MIEFLKKVTPFLALSLFGFVLIIYHCIFPGRENWGYLVAYIFIIPTILLLLVDLIMRAFKLKYEILISIQLVIVILAFFQFFF